MRNNAYLQYILITSLGYCTPSSAARIGRLTTTHHPQTLLNPHKPPI